MNREVLAGRECRACYVCCESLNIDSPELQKFAGHRCKHLQADNGCGIYPARYNLCREFQCGWRLFAWVPEILRPDLSGVLFRLEPETSGEAGASPTGVIVSLLHRRALNAEGLAETVGYAINAGIPIDIHVPAPPGFVSNRVRINDASCGAVQAGDKVALLEIIKKARQACLQRPVKPAVLKHAPRPEATPEPVGEDR